MRSFITVICLILAGTVYVLADDTATIGGSGTGEAGTDTGSSSGPKTFKDLDESCARLKTAKAVLSAWNAFIADTAVPESQRALARIKLEYWKSLADSGAVRLGGQWVERDKISTPHTEEDRFLREAWAALDVRDAKLSESKFIAASRANPLGVRGNFSLGMLYSLNARKPAVAEQNFRECVKRRTDVTGSLNRAQQEDLAAALNNMGVVQVRQKKFDVALKNWQAAYDAAGPSIEVIQNVGRLAYVGSNPRGFTVTKSSAQRASELYTSLTASAEKMHFEPQVGWLFMDIADPSRPDIKIKLEDRSCMHCAGVGRVDCPACSKGVQATEYYTIVGRNTATGERITASNQGTKKCPKCHGKGTLDCKLCIHGIDATLTGSTTTKKKK